MLQNIKQMHPLKKNLANENLFKDIANKYGTPCYLYDKDRLVENLNNLDNALKENFEKYHICYSAKANSNPHLLKLMIDTLPDIGTDCSSPGEVFISNKVGIPGSRILYTGNYELISDLQMAYDNHCNINLDDITSIQRLQKVGIPEIISFRLNPGFGNGSFAQITTAGLHAKFGIPHENIIDAYKKAQNLGIKRFGLQCMAGSGNLDEEYFEKVFTLIMDNVQKISMQTDIEFEYISMGGGFGIPYKENEKPLEINRLFQRLSKIFYKYFARDNAPSLWLEPGKYIIADAGYLLTKVVATKKSYKNYIGTDAGMETLMRNALYGAYHKIYKLGKESKDKEVYDFTGQICENTDRIATDRLFSNVKEGDLLAVMDTGAYGYSMSHNFNTRPRAAEILVSKEDFTLIRKRETLEDIFSNCNV